MRFKAIFPWIVLQSVHLGDHTHAHVSQFLSSLGRVNDPTPVLSDTCFSQPIRRERETLQAWNKSGPYLRNHNTWLICVRVWVCVSALLCQICRLTDTREKKVKLKETIPIHLDWRHDQRDWVSLRISHLFCLKNLILFHQIVPLTIWELWVLRCHVVIPDSHILIIFYSVYSPVAWRELTILLSCNETPCKKKKKKSLFLRKGCFFVEETDMDIWNTHTYTLSGVGRGNRVCFGWCYH